MCCPDPHPAELAGEFPGWTIWRSDAGRWWATRRHALNRDEYAVGCAMTIDADDIGTLRNRLRDQEDRASRQYESWAHRPERS